jgi:hypothetical protein
MMEAVCNSEMSPYFYETKRRYVPECCYSHIHCPENLKTYTIHRVFSISIPVLIMFGL